MGRKKISVIIPTIGRGESLTACLTSLFAQTLKPGEIIVVDNSGGKEVKKLIFELRKTTSISVRYIIEKKKGAAYARNKGVKITKYNTLAFIDDDCIAYKTWLYELMKASGTSPIIKGRNKDGLPNNFFSYLNYYKDESFLRTKLFDVKKKQFFVWLDTKNCLIQKFLFTKKHLQFNHFLIFQDLDFTMQAYNQNVVVNECSRAIVYHYGRSTIWDSIKRWIQLGRDTYYFQTKWKADLSSLKPIKLKGKKSSILIMISNIMSLMISKIAHLVTTITHL